MPLPLDRHAQDICRSLQERDIVLGKLPLRTAVDFQYPVGRAIALKDDIHGAANTVFDEQGGGPGRARQALNADTIREMHRAFAAGGRKAIDKMMKQQPAVFLKLLVLLVLLVPRELKVEHTGGVKAMSDEQLEAGIEAITAMLAARDAGG